MYKGLLIHSLLCSEFVELTLNNNDIELQTPIEYVVGYICKGLLDSQVINGGGKGRNTPNQELSK